MHVSDPPPRRTAHGGGAPSQVCAAAQLPADRPLRGHLLRPQADLLGIAQQAVAGRPQPLVEAEDPGHARGQIQSGDFSLSDEGYRELKNDYLALVLTVVDIADGAAYLFEKESPADRRNWKAELELEQYRRVLDIDRLDIDSRKID